MTCNILIARDCSECNLPYCPCDEDYTPDEPMFDDDAGWDD